MNKLAFICTFIGLPIMAGEWDGPFWVQVVLMIATLLPLTVSVLRACRQAPTFDEWEESKHEHRESNGAESRAV